MLRLGTFGIVSRIHSPRGAVVFGDARLALWAARLQHPLPALVFLGNSYEVEEKNDLQRYLTELLDGWDLEAQFLNIAPQEGLIYQTFLPHYAGSDSPVIWLGGSWDEAAQSAFGLFLEGGGRLIVGSWSPPSFLQDIFPIDNFIWANRGSVRGLFRNETIGFSGAHYGLKLRPPAVPLLIDDQYRAAGLRLDSGVYRAVYLSFNLPGQEAKRRGLLEFALASLLQTEQRADLSAVGRASVDGIAILGTDRPIPMRAVVGAQVASAELVVRSEPEL